MTTEQFGSVHTSEGTSHHSRAVYQLLLSKLQARLGLHERADTDREFRLQCARGDFQENRTNKAFVGSRYVSE